jgi:hypothetical protein
VSLSPQTHPPFGQPEPVPRPHYRWYHKVAAVLFAIFCFELGVFLLVFPWTDFWERNYFATWTPLAQQVWMNAYFRGTVSGLGLVNIFVSFVEVLRLRRFSV